MRRMRGVGGGAAFCFSLCPVLTQCHFKIFGSNIAKLFWVEGVQGVGVGAGLEGLWLWG